MNFWELSAKKTDLAYFFFLVSF